MLRPTLPGVDERVDDERVVDHRFVAPARW
jgi:hypothetical protein